jgi:hypothetical protein
LEPIITHPLQDNRTPRCDRTTFFHLRRLERTMTMKIVLALVFSLMISMTQPASAFFGGFCGVGCHAAPSGACLRDGWEQGRPVRNECPATSRPTPPCGPHHRWSRQSLSCILR